MPNFDPAMYGIRSATDGGLLFCGVSDQQWAINGVDYKWAVNRGLTWSLGTSKIGAIGEQDLKAVFDQIFNEIADFCDFEVTYSPNHRTANFVVMQRRLDGPGGVLAQHGIPMPGNNQFTQVYGEYDDSERFGIFDGPPPQKGMIDIRRTGRHEVSHGGGLGHRPFVRGQSPALMDPTYSDIIYQFQQPDIAEWVRRYGKSKRNNAPLPPAPPVGDSLGVELIIQQADAKFKLEGKAKRI